MAESLALLGTSGSAAGGAAGAGAGIAGGGLLGSLGGSAAVQGVGSGLGGALASAAGTAGSGSVGALALDAALGLSKAAGDAIAQTGSSETVGSPFSTPGGGSAGASITSLFPLLGSNAGNQQVRF